MRIGYLMIFLPAIAIAGGSNYGVAPGSRDIAGKITEWSVPTPRFARDPAPGPVVGLANETNRLANGLRIPVDEKFKS